MAKDMPEILSEFNIKPSSEKMDKFMVEALTACLERHLMLLEFCRKIERTFKYYNMMMASSAIFLFCVLAYLLSTFNVSQSNLVNVIEYFVLSNTQQFFLCYCGQMLKDKNERVTFELTNNEWYKGGREFRRMLLVMLSNSMKSFTLTAGDLMLLDISQYLNVTI
jgi:hypothetical protein